MKYLIDGNTFKVKWKGEFVRVEEGSSDFILDTDNNELNGATLREVADSNDVTYGKKDSIAKLVTKIETSFSELDLLEKNAMSMEEKVEQIVKDGIENGLTDGQIASQMLTEAEVPLRKVMPLFRKMSEKLGFRISAKKRAEKIQGLIDELNFKPEDSDDVTAMVEKITKSVPDTDRKQATGALKRWAKKNEVDLPKVRAAAGGFAAKVYEWIMANPNAESETLRKWIVDDQGKREGVARRFVAQLEFARKYADLVNEEESDAEAA